MDPFQIARYGILGLLTLFDTVLLTYSLLYLAKRFNIRPEKKTHVPSGLAQFRSDSRYNGRCKHPYRRLPVDVISAHPFFNR